MKLLALIVLTLFGAIAYGATLPTEDEQKDDDFVLPEGIPTCDQDDFELNKCLRDAVQQMIPKLHKGLPELNIPPLDPFSIDNGRYEYSSGAIQGRLALKGVKVYGMSRAEVKDIRTEINENGLTSEADVYFPRIFLEGTYKADVKFNDLKMNPRGYFNISMTDIKTTQKMSGDFETIKGKKHLRLTKFDMEPEVGDMKIYATGLFPDPTLNAIILDFVNQYWPEMYKFMLPETKVHWEPIMLEAANQFLSTVPFEKLISKS